MSLLFVILIGLGWGSFATMAVYRIPNGMNWIGKKPFCPLCGHDLSFFDYVSVLSYFWHKGKCRYCHKQYDLHIAYLLVEIFTCAGFVAAYLIYGFSELFILFSFLATAIIVLVAIEMKYKIIATKPLIVVLMTSLIYRTLLDHSIYGTIIGVFVAAIIGLLIRHVIFIKNPAVGLDYLQYKDEDRFKGPLFDYIKMFLISGVLLEFNAIIIALAITLLLLLINISFFKSIKFPTTAILAVSLIVMVLESIF